MKIVHIASEMSPIAKAGGLGDVVHGLAKEQQRLGHDVSVVLPKYDIIKYKFLENLELERGDLWSFEDTFRYHNSVWRASVDGIPTYLIEAHHNQYYFNRGSIYGCFNDVERFLYFCRTALEFLYTDWKKIDIIHLHDWPTAPVAMLAKKLYRDIGFQFGAIIQTIHSIEHQGKCSPRSLTRIGLRGDDFRTASRCQDNSDPSIINLLKGGIVYSDFVTTVSPTYANEIKTKEHGFGLETTIQKHEHKVRGVLNGIELEFWNPATDKSLPNNYPSNATFIDKIIEMKKKNREALFKKLNLKNTSGPLVACVSRIVEQKGPKLIQEALHHTLEKGGAFILLGSTHDHRYEREFQHIQEHYKSNKGLYIHLQFDEHLARQIYAAADVIVIPSIFEPCGLTQMIALRYATVPVVRFTGGLADTIVDVQNTNLPANTRSGFIFNNPTPQELRQTMDRAFNCYQKNTSEWKTLMANGLNLDFSWKTSALKYQKIYEYAIKGYLTASKLEDAI